MNTYATSAEKLINYMSIRSDDLSDCNSKVENELWSENQRLIEGVSDPDDPDKRIAVSRAIHEREKRAARTFRYMLLISVCSFVEESVKQLAQLKFPDWKDRLPKNGSELEKYAAIFVDANLVDRKELEPQIDSIIQFIWLRNCVVHAWGCLRAYKYPHDIQQVVKDVNRGKSPPLIGIDKKEFLWFTEDLVSHAICDADDVIEVLTKASFDRSFRMARILES